MEFGNQAQQASSSPTHPIAQESTQPLPSNSVLVSIPAQNQALMTTQVPLVLPIQSTLVPLTLKLDRANFAI